jgi:AcrR family transcriptional regulator
MQIATPDRILAMALQMFGSRGYEATALDALAARLGIRKQTILHHFGSKEMLLTAVTDYTVARFETTVTHALERQGPGTKRLERVIRSVFSLAAKEPELLAFARELARLGGSPLRRFTDLLAPLMERATSFISFGMVGMVGMVGSAGTPTAHDQQSRATAHAILMSVYAAVLGAATEAEVRSSLGLAPSGRLVLRRRREVLSYITQLMAQPEHAEPPMLNREPVAG